MTRLSDLPRVGILHVYTYADLDAGKLEGMTYFEQLTHDGERYKGGGVLVMVMVNQLEKG